MTRKIWTPELEYDRSWLEDWPLLTSRETVGEMKDQPENWPKNVVLGSDLREAATVWAVVTRLCTKPGTELSTLFVQAIAHSWSGWLDGKTVEEMENEVLDRLPGLVEKGLISAAISHGYSTR